MNAFISQKFRFYSFLSMVLLVFVHGYNLQNRYMQPFTIVEEPLRFTTFLEYFLANGIFRFRIPMLFLISGFLFAFGDEKPHGIRMKKRLRTLLIPYLCWSAFGLLITFLLQQFPYIAAIVKATQLDQIGDNRPYAAIGWGGMLLRWTLVPIAFQLWFIRSLLVYNAAYPLLKKAVLKIPKIWFPISIFLWLTTFSFPFIEGEGLLFFSLGIWIQKTNFNIEKAPHWLSIKIWFPVFLIAAVVKTILAFHFGWSITSFIVLSLLHKTCVFAGLITMWYGADVLVKWCMERKWFVWLSGFSFIIYATHVPIVCYGIDWLFAYTNHLPNYRLIDFFLLPCIIITLAILFGFLLRKLTPKLYAILTGGRGLM